jgi:hypothetical protein
MPGMGLPTASATAAEIRVRILEETVGGRVLQ